MSEKEMARPFTGRQINWNQVFYFSEIASAGSIKDAATKLGLTASTLSLHLSQLEEDLKIQLFLRQHRKLTLTPEGTRLFLHAKSMFETGQRMLDLVSPIPLGAYSVSVAVVPSSSLDVTNRILCNYVTGRGMLNMKILRSDYTDLEKGLSDARFDFGFSDRVPERRDITHRMIAQSSIGFYAAEKYAQIPFPELLQKMPLLVCNSEPKHRSLAEQTLIEADLLPAGVIISDYHSTILDLCHQGAGIGVLSETAVRRAGLQSLASLTILTGAPTLRDRLYVLWAHGAENTEAVKILQSTLAEAPTGTA